MKRSLPVPVDRQHQVEQVRKTNALRLRDQSGEHAVTIEAPWPT
jgi:hypothetical protein